MTRAVAHHGASRSFTGAVTATCPEVAARLRTAASSSSPSLDLTRIAPALSARMVSGVPELSKVARVRFWIGRAGSRATISPVESASSASPPTRPGLAASTARKVSATGVEGSDASAASRRRANSPARMSISSAAASRARTRSAFRCWHVKSARKMKRRPAATGPATPAHDRAKPQKTNNPGCGPDAASVARGLRARESPSGACVRVIVIPILSQRYRETPPHTPNRLI